MGAAIGPNCQRIRPENIQPWACWRREWDSNPRYSFPHTRFPSVRLKPLGHLSVCPLMTGRDKFCKGAQPRRRIFQQLADISMKSAVDGAETAIRPVSLAAWVGARIADSSPSRQFAPL